MNKLRLQSSVYSSLRAINKKTLVEVLGKINNNMQKRNLVLGDFLVILPFAWILSQALINGDWLWGLATLFCFDIYAVRRSRWDV